MPEDLFRLPLVRRINRRDLLAVTAAPLAAVDPAVSAMVYSDSRLPEVPRRQWRVHPALPAPGALCPRLRESYRRMLPVTCREGAIDRLRFRIHTVSPEHDRLAARCGRVLAMGFWLTYDYLGRAPAGVCDLWLRPGGTGGGEEYQGSLYLHAVDENRSPLEWVRELLHEYSHRALPAFGPFDAPERHGSGYLGEKLLLRCLHRSNLLKSAWPGLDGEVGGRYVSQSVEFPRKSDGDEPEGGRAMERFIGEMLGVETVYGPQVLAGLLRAYRDLRPERLPLFLGEVLAAGPARREVRPLDEGRVSFRLLTPPGRWSLQVTAGGDDELSLRDALNGEPLPREQRNGMLRFALVAAPGAWMNIICSRPVALAFQVRE